MNDQHHFNIRENRCEGLNIQTPLQYALRCKYVIGEAVQGLQVVVELYFTMENNSFSMLEVKVWLLFVHKSNT